jgi:hypothetical protein
LCHELEALVEAAQDVQYKGTVLNGLTNISKSVSHALHFVAVVVDGEGTLGEGAKLGVEQHGVGLTIVEELLFDAKPSCLSGEAVRLVDDVQEVGGDGVEEPGDDDAVHARPRRIGEVRDVTEDVVLQGEAAEDEEDVAMPLGVVGGLEIKNDRNQILDVLDSSSLAVQVGDGRGLRVDEVVVVMGRIHTEAFQEGSGLLL